MSACTITGISQLNEEHFNYWVEKANSALDVADSALAQSAIDNARAYAQNDICQRILFAYSAVLDNSPVCQVNEFISNVEDGDLSVKSAVGERFVDYQLVARLYEKHALWLVANADRDSATAALAKAAEVAERGEAWRTYIRVNLRRFRMFEDVGSFDVAVNGYLNLLTLCRRERLHAEETDVLFRIALAFLRMGDVSTAQVYIDEMANGIKSPADKCKYWLAQSAIGASESDSASYRMAVCALNELKASNKSVASLFSSAIDVVEAQYYMSVGRTAEARKAVDDALNPNMPLSLYSPSRAYLRILDAKICIYENKLERAHDLLRCVDSRMLRKTDVELYVFYTSVGSDLCAATGDEREAYALAKRHSVALDSMQMEVAGNELLFKTLISRRDSAVVSQVNMISKSENNVEDEATAQYAMVVLAFAVVIGAVICCFGLSYRNSRLKTSESERRVATLAAEIERRKAMLEAQRAQLKSKNGLLQSELRFAQHIQADIMPRESILTTPGVAEHFIFFRPCYIVSGDFYWFFDSGDKLFVCAADATGHGIPGAFISMVALALLADIAATPDNRRPSRLLEELSLSLSKVLRNNADIVNADSIDLSMLCIDRESRRVSISMARHVAYIAKADGSSELVQGTKRSVGEIIDVDGGRPFTDIPLNVSNGDCVYLASDGFVSQFGGPENQKFKRKRFEALLSEVHLMDADSQKSAIEKRFDDWRGECEQTDDVLVIGVRIGDL